MVDIELGKRNVKKYIKRYRNNDLYILIKMFAKPIYSKTKYDGCIVVGRDGKVKKLILLVYHLKGFLHYEGIKEAEHCDT